MSASLPNAPSECPGAQSESAGKANACAGCPNRQLCSSGVTRAVDPDLAVIARRMSTVSHKVLVLSGKGGVGKSTVCCTLARALAQNSDDNVSLLDIDICGPSVPRIMGVSGETVHNSGSGWSPVFIEDNLCVVSVGFLLDSADAAVVWRGPRKNGLIKQFVRDVDWPDSRFLLVDTPPGTSDEHLSVVQYMNASGIDGALMVSTPQEVSLLDVRKQVNFCRKTGVRVLGVVENMAEFVCPKCQKSSTVFPSRDGGVRAMCDQMNVPYLGRIPLDARLTRCCDEGRNFLSEFSESAAAKAYIQLANTIRQSCEDVCPAS